MFKLRQILAFTVGNFQWQPPHWLRNGWGRLRRHPRAVVTGFVALGAVVGGGMWVRSWPAPVTVRVTVMPPGVTPLGKKLEPQPLVIEFAQSVAPLDRVGKELKTGIRLEPSATGRWIWAGDSTLRFEPRDDWPADTAYRVTLDRSVVAPHIRLGAYRFDWRTPTFSATVREIEFYQDPRDPTVKQVVATVDLSHRVDPGTIAPHAEIRMLGRGTVEPFDVHYDEHHRVAYLRTKPMRLPERENFAKLTLSPGIRTIQGGAVTRAPAEEKCRVPDIYSFFRVSETGTAIAWTEDGKPEQVLTLSTSCAARTPDLARAITLRVLPKRTPTIEDDRTTWNGPREIPADVLAASPVIAAEALPSRDPQTTEHAFRFHAPAEGQLYVQVEAGVRAPGDFVLGQVYDNVVDVPRPAASIAFEGDGALLALSGERKLSVRSRGVPRIEYEIARVATSQINHLVSQTRGNFANPTFRGYAFDEENISRIAVERQSLADASPFVENATSFDFGPHLALPADGGSERGLFFLRAHPWDPKKDVGWGDDVPQDRRFLLITDLGLIVKENADDSRDVFVASILTGGPVAGAQVAVLGKNGVPLAQAATDADGRVHFDSVARDERDREPVAFVARLGEDVSFLPYDRSDRRLDFSRFDTGGDQVRSGAELDAFLFTERGVYRPGDPIHVGYIVKRRDWGRAPAGLPLEMEVVDARGRVVTKKRIAVPAGGLGEFHCPTTAASATGRYAVNLYLLRGEERVSLLASASAWVKEFLPDRMKIAAELMPSLSGGWIAPDDVKALVRLKNLYGTPAGARRVTTKLELSPSGFRFDAYPGYQFDDPLWKQWTSDDLRSITLPDATTDDAGAATVALDLGRFERRTYAMTLSIEGFEGGGGRSVGTQIDFLVSPLERIVGCKPDGDLSYIPAGTKRAARFMAVDHALKSVAVAELRFRLVEETFLSVLKRQGNGNYAYESVERDREVSNEVRALPADGADFTLPTDRPGSFRLEVCDATGTKVSQLAYTVVGKGEVTRSMEQTAELQIKLPRHEYHAGDEVEIAITAPYGGGGLITLERDRVYAQTWFESSGTSSVQRLRIPKDFEGTGYVNVTFVRALDSKEVFMSPLSYAVEPITVGREERRLGLQLTAPAQAKPGEPMAIHFRTDRPSRIVVYAVDQGILQVTGYERPQPLDRFFRKTALMVGTSQILDLILPEFSMLRAAAAGGDADMLTKNLNPFRRVTEKPVVYWSGVIDAGPEDRTVTYDVPDFFDGTLKIMAVAFAPEAVDSAEAESLVRSRFVITPAVPTMVAPGDTFEVGVTVSNGGPEADVTLSAEPSSQLEIVKTSSMPLRLGAGKETTATFVVRAKGGLGSGSLEFCASGGGEECRRKSTMSVRPATPYRTEVRSARFARGTLDVLVSAALRPEFRRAEATISTLPLGLARGLERYLEDYPHGCSEQLASGALCRLALADEVDFGLPRATVAAQLETTFDKLRQRQNDQGGFGYWSAGPSGPLDFISIYVTQLLVEAKAAGFPPPADMLAAAFRNLTRMANEARPRTLEEARMQAWAIYLLTRGETVTTNAIVNLRDTLDSNFADSWKNDLTAVYLAGALELLQQDSEARRLVAGYRCGRGCDGAFVDGLAADAVYVAILGRNFPDLLRRLPAGEFDKVLEPIQRGSFSTVSAAAAVLALKSYSATLAQGSVRLGLAEIHADGREVPLDGSGTLLRKAEFSPEATALRFSAGVTPLGVFCQVVDSGFEMAVPTTAESRGLEIYREFPKRARVGEPITVHLFVRALDGKDLANVALVDLLPGGFEVVESSLQPGVGTLPGWDCVEVREDRVVVFGDVGASVREISYQIKATSAGRFVVPPVFAEAMYDRGTHGCSAAGEIEVSAR